MNDHGMNHATPTSDKARVTKMEEVLTAPLLEAKEIIATHQGTLSFLAGENERLRQEIEDLQSALLTGRVPHARPSQSKPS